jgi:hypothetical protein
LFHEHLKRLGRSLVAGILALCHGFVATSLMPRTYFGGTSSRYVLFVEITIGEATTSPAERAIRRPAVVLGVFIAATSFEHLRVRPVSRSQATQQAHSALFDVQLNGYLQRPRDESAIVDRHVLTDREADEQLATSAKWPGTLIDRSARTSQVFARRAAAGIRTAAHMTSRRPRATVSTTVACGGCAGNDDGTVI